MGKINTYGSGLTQPDPPKNSALYYLKSIYNAICCLGKRGVDCDDPIHVTICDTPDIVEIESATVQGCWQDATTKEKVSLEIIRDEDGTFLSYEVHRAGGSPTTTPTLEGFEPCPTPARYETTRTPFCTTDDPREPKYLVGYSDGTTEVVDIIDGEDNWCECDC